MSAKNKKVTVRLSNDEVKDVVKSLNDINRYYSNVNNIDGVTESMAKTLQSLNEKLHEKAKKPTIYRINHKFHWLMRGAHLNSDSYEGNDRDEILEDMILLKEEKEIERKQNSEAEVEDEDEDGEGRMKKSSRIEMVDIDSNHVGLSKAKLIQDEGKVFENDTIPVLIFYARRHALTSGTQMKYIQADDVLMYMFPDIWTSQDKKVKITSRHKDKVNDALFG